jgi:hypothetical protein
MLTYQPDSAGLSGAAFTVSITRSDSQCTPVAGSSHGGARQCSPADELSGCTRCNWNREYVLRMFARDRYNADRRDSLALRMPVQQFTTTAPALSDVELATVIRQGKQGGIFYKNTLDVIPNVGSMYSEEQVCFTYAEAYNMLSDTGGFVTRTNVYDAVGKEIISRDRPRKRAGESSVIRQLPVKNLRTGSYTLTYRFSTDGKVRVRPAKLFVYNRRWAILRSWLPRRRCPCRSIWRWTKASSIANFNGAATSSLRKRKNSTGH